MRNNFSSFSSNILNYFWDISKNLILSIYFLFELFFSILIYFFVYLESLVIAAVTLSGNGAFKNLTFFFSVFSGNYLRGLSFYNSFLEYLKVSQISKMTSDVLIFISLYSFFSAYALTGSASVAFSNEGLWLSILTLAVIYFFYYLRTIDTLGHDAITSEIENLKKLILKNSELATSVSDLESQVIVFQEETMSVLEDWYLATSDFIDSLDSETSSKANASQIESVINEVFIDHLRGLAQLSLAREDLIKVINLKDQKEEAISEVFES